MDDIKKKLQTLNIPPPSRTAEDRAWEVARIAFQNRETQTTETKSWWHLRRWSFVGGLATATFAFVIINSLVTRQTPEMQQFVQSLQQDKQVLSQVEEVFPNRLSGIVTNENGTELVLSKEERPNPTQPVVLELSKSGKKTRIVTFSGESVEFDTGSSNEKLEIMVTGDGGVLIMGSNFIWRSDSGEKKEEKFKGFDIKAKPLDIEL